jgi:hypothetical protein
MTRPGNVPGAAKENRDRSRVGLVLVKATAGLFISQPALSQQIRRLEGEWA